MSVETVRKSIVDAPPNWLLGHQCNVTTIKAVGVAALLFDVEPEMAYDRCGAREVGGYHMGRRVLNLYGQRLPGRPRKAETAAMRLEWFLSALRAACIEAHRRGFDGIALPHGVGCGYAGGNWAQYAMGIAEVAKASPVPIVQYQIK